MRPASHLQRVGLALVAMVVIATAAILAAQNRFHSGQAPATSAAPQDQPAKGNPLRKAFFGDLHVHTSWSNDAYQMSVRTTPDDAYLFAKGEAIRLHTGEAVKLVKPLDFMGVTEHAEYLGVMARLQDPRSPLYNHRISRDQRSKDSDVRVKAMLEIMGSVMTGKPIPEFMDKKLVGEIWQDIVKTANRQYQPGKFTAFIGVEWSSCGPKGVANLHRNIIFRGDKATDAPFTTFDSLKPEDLWAFLESARKQGFQVLAIPHNPNMSDGLMFRAENSDGQPLDRAYVERRIRNEPLVEVKQIKGTSETHPLLSPDDEFANYEILDYTMDPVNFGKVRGLAKGSYVRDAYRMGLVIEEQLGVNPYKFGVIASGDTHNAASPYRHDNMFGHIGTDDDTPEQRLHGRGPMSAVIRLCGTCGLCGVWAEENNREAIFDALARKETFGTSGTRIQVRLFGGWGYAQGDDKRQDFAKIGYDKGVPMGGDLALRPDKAKSPTFLVWAEKDPDAANLDRIQIIKGWAKYGLSFEKIYDVAWSGGRAPELKTGRVPPVGSTVDVAKATYRNSIGADNLSAVWQDPEFDPTLRAFYYVRVLEIPTPRWSAFDAKKLGIIPPDGGMLQERAYTSPVWYTPTEAELAKGREKALTVASLGNEKAMALSTEEIRALLVGKEVRIKNLVTGAEYDASYGQDGMRTLASTAAFASVHGQGVAKNPYQIKDGRLATSLSDGSQFSSRLFRLGTRHLAAKDDEAGYVNYEVFPR